MGLASVVLALPLPPRLPVTVAAVEEREWLLLASFDPFAVATVAHHN